MVFFEKNLKEKNTIFNNLRREHETWKHELQQINKPFFMIPTDFSHLFLKDMSGGALKLYLFLGFHSKYRTGESWYTTEQVANFFNKDPRTVAGWFSELESLGLIFRAQKGIMMKANTFMRPFGIFFNDKCYLAPTAEDVDLTIDTILEEGNNPKQAIILNSGIIESNLIIIFKNSQNSSNVYNVCCFFDINFNMIKKVWSKAKYSDIPIENFEINTPLAHSKFSTQTVYNHIIQFYDDKVMEI